MWCVASCLCARRESSPFSRLEREKKPNCVQAAKSILLPKGAFLCPLPPVPTAKILPSSSPKRAEFVPDSQNQVP